MTLPTQRRSRLCCTGALRRLRAQVQHQTLHDLQSASTMALLCHQMTKAAVVHKKGALVQAPRTADQSSAHSRQCQRH